MTVRAALPLLSTVDRVPPTARRPPPVVFAMISSAVRPANRFEFELEDPVLKRSLRHGYDVIELPVLG